MSPLARRQRALLATLKGRSLDPGDAVDAAWLTRAQTHIRMLREVMLWWRQLGLARVCPMTTAVLKQSGHWQRALHGFVRDTPGSAYIGVQAERFLEYAAMHGDALVVASARTECALRASVLDEGFRASIQWPCDPVPLLRHCTTGAPCDANAGGGPHIVHVGRAGPCSIEWETGSVA